MANDPAAVPVGVARRAGAAVGVVRDFLNDNLSPTLDGFRSGVKTGWIEGSLWLAARAKSLSVV